ncbi:MAG TPA: hypothetical protein ENO16_06385 [Chromatiales bacterium]|nr:hypothetical protein [Chromatiales bacterium]
MSAFTRPLPRHAQHLGAQGLPDNPLHAMLLPVELLNYPASDNGCDSNCGESTCGEQKCSEGSCGRSDES